MAILKCLECKKRFERRQGGGRHTFCSNQCAQRNRFKRKYYAKDGKFKKQLRENQKSFYESNPDWRRENAIRNQEKKYGLPEGRLSILLSQGCMVCGAGSSFYDVELHIDHDHDTGEFRGILCESCNLALGKLYDNPVFIGNLFDYIMEWIYDKENRKRAMANMVRFQ